VFTIQAPFYYNIINIE